MSAIATRPRPALALLVLAALIALVGAVGEAGASTARTLGKTERTPEPSCPKTPCEAVGSVTGFQLIADGDRGLFKARQNLSVVGWTIDVSDPKGSQHNFFADFYQSNAFGMVPTARISVIKRQQKRDYKLKSQSPVVQLGSVLGSRQTYTLNQPLKMRKGEFLALTIPTWAPSFAVNLGSNTNVWRSSRVAGKCSGTANIKAGKPQQKVKSVHSYGCDYKTARLLYWGYYVPR